MTLPHPLPPGLRERMEFDTLLVGDGSTIPFAAILLPVFIIGAGMLLREALNSVLRRKPLEERIEEGMKL